MIRSRSWLAVATCVASIAAAAHFAQGTQDKKPIEGPRYIAYDHNCVHICDRLGELPHLHVPPGKDTHPFCLHACLSAHAEFVAFSAIRPQQAPGMHSLDIYLWDRKNDKLLPLPGANSLAHDDYPSISADGNLIAFHTADDSAHRSAGIRLYDRKAGKLVSLPNLDVATSSGIPALSPEGRYLAFTALTAKGDRDVYLYDRESAKMMELPGLNSPADEWSVRVNAGARLLAFCSRRGGKTADVHVYDRAAGKLLPLPNLDLKTQHLECDISADGRFLALVVGRTHLRLYDRQAGKLVDLPNVHHQGKVYFWPALSRE
jgi:hypothetical protein